MFSTFPLDVIEEKLNNLKPIPYNKFFWWRRWSTKNKPLSKYSPLIDKIKNGDFDESPYYWQIKYCESEINHKEALFHYDYQKFLEQTRLDRTRRRRLIDDYEKDELERINLMKKEFTMNFHLNKETLEKEIEEFDGSIEDFYIYCNKKFCKKLTPIPSFR